MKKNLLLLMALLAAPFAQAVEVINLPATSSLASDDLIYVVHSPSTGGTSQKITLADFATNALVQMPSVMTLSSTQTVTGPKTFTMLLSGTITNALHSGTADYALTSSSASHADSAAALDDGGASLSVSFATTAQLTPNGHTLDDLWSGASGSVAYAMVSGSAGYALDSGSAVVLSGSLNAAQLGVGNTWTATQYHTGIINSTNRIYTTGTLSVLGGAAISAYSLQGNPVLTVMQRTSVNGTNAVDLQQWVNDTNSGVNFSGTMARIDYLGNFRGNVLSGSAILVLSASAGTTLFSAATNVNSVTLPTTSGTLMLLGGTIASSQVANLFSGTNTWTNPQTFSAAPAFSTGTAGNVMYFGTSGTVAQSSKLFWDAVNNRLGIGIASPIWSIHVAGTSGNIANLGATNTSTYATTGGGNLYATADSGTAFTNGSRAGQFIFGAAVDASHTFYSASSISCFATEATNGAGGFGSNLQFFTTTNGTNGRTAKMTLGNDGALSVVGSLTFGGGATIKKPLMATGTLTFGTISAGSYSDQSLSVSGAADSDIVTLGIPSAGMAPNCSYRGYVSASGTVTIRCVNVGSTSQTPTAGLFRVLVVQF